MKNFPKKNGVSYYGTGIHRCWWAMKQRCRNKNNPVYSKIGGKGIKVCERWNKFANFISDMGERPEKGHLDRTDLNGDYCKENCRWVTHKEKCRNRSTNVFITYKGKKYCLKDLSEKIKVSPYTIKRRHALGRDLKKRLSFVYPKKLIDLDFFVFGGERNIDIDRLREFGCTLQQIGDHYNLSRERVRQIIKNK